MINIQIPIRSHSSTLALKPVMRAQLYNLDDNEKFTVQHNPLTEPSTEYAWADDPWLGTGIVHAQFLGVGQTEFEILLRLVVAPGAPQMESENIDPPIMEYSNDLNLVIIENVYRALQRWGEIREDKGRSSLIMYICPGSGESSFRGRMTSLALREEDRFRNGRLRRASIRIGFKEWRTTGR